MPKRWTRALWLALAVAVWAPRPAAAYLDPATGSMLLQLLLGGFAGVAVLVKMFWRRILGLFGSSKQAVDEHPTE